MLSKKTLKNLIKNNSQLNDEKFTLCKSFLKEILKDNKELNKNTNKLMKESNSFNYSDDDLADEIWREYPTNKIFSVSNLGRVKYKNEVIQQIDRKGKVGYLIIDAKKLLTKGCAEDFIPRDFVYNLVAITFLGKVKNDGFHVHHITNNGYDNSTDNLILLTQVQHSEIHGFKIGCT